MSVAGSARKLSPFQRSPYDGASESILAGGFGGAIAATAFVFPGVFATAQQIDMNVVDQPGYVPSTDEEQLSSA